MNVRLIGGPANGELVVLPNDRKEVVIPELLTGQPYHGEDTPLPVKYHYYRPRKPINNNLSSEQIIAFYLDGDLSNG